MIKIKKKFLVILRYKNLARTQKQDPSKITITNKKIGFDFFIVFLIFCVIIRKIKWVYVIFKFHFRRKKKQ